MTRHKKPKCLVCGTDAGRITRGLCSAHYLQMQRRLQKLTPAAAAAWEEQLIAEGKLLPKRQGKRPNVGDPFAESFEKIKQAMPGALKTASELGSESREELLRRTKMEIEIELARIETKKALSPAPADKRKKGAG